MECGKRNCQFLRPIKFITPAKCNLDPDVKTKLSPSWLIEPIPEGWGLQWPLTGDEWYWMERMRCTVTFCLGNSGYTASKCIESAGRPEHYRILGGWLCWLYYVAASVLEMQLKKSSDLSDWIDKNIISFDYTNNKTPENVKLFKKNLEHLMNEMKKLMA